jgi:GNAT superfamily N-acetyltransferase
MVFADLELAKRLELTEGRSAIEFAEARRRLDPASGATWIECAGAYAIFDGIDSPITQCFGLGLFEALTSASLDTIERFFLDRGAPVMHELSPLAGVAATNLLCARGYRPIEMSTVLQQPVTRPPGKTSNGAIARLATEEESMLWAGLSARGWANEHPEMRDFIEQFGLIGFARDHGANFIAVIDGQPGATGGLNLHDGVALFAGAATIPEMRRRGLQAALLEARLNYAFEHDCELAMMVTEVGSQSQRNAERSGFRVAYTRTKWRLNSA